MRIFFGNSFSSVGDNQGAGYRYHFRHYQRWFCRSADFDKVVEVPGNGNRIYLCCQHSLYPDGFRVYKSMEFLLSCFPIVFDDYEYAFHFSDSHKEIHKKQ